MELKQIEYDVIDFNRTSVANIRETKRRTEKNVASAKKKE